MSTSCINKTISNNSVMSKAVDVSVKHSGKDDVLNFGIQNLGKDSIVLDRPGVNGSCYVIISESADTSMRFCRSVKYLDPRVLAPGEEHVFEINLAKRLDRLGIAKNGSYTIEWDYNGLNRSVSPVLHRKN